MLLNNIDFIPSNCSFCHVKIDTVDDRNNSAENINDRSSVEPFCECTLVWCQVYEVFIFLN